MMTVYMRATPTPDALLPQVEDETTILEDIGQMDPTTEAENTPTITAQQLKEFIQKHVVDSQNLVSDEEDGDYNTMQGVENEFDDIM